MLDPNHPPAILRAAWRRVRLDVIRAAAVEVLAELEALDRHGSVAPGSTPPSMGGLAEASAAARPEPAAGMLSEASRAALLACCDELRVEAGLPAVVPTSPAVARDDPEWRRVFDSELLRYRSLAGASLQRSLGAP